ncbi:hypothetical protein DWW79_13155 [Alistipes sp. AF17-16]|uniref:hypothetical protein n=1 Tax=Alistipes TaxID=239759 RepID=UPI000E4E4833|nr:MULTISPECIES: hypothetical protein [Alistipes]RHR60402.1 hypothetical protein DWW79_13155 [Alistipes sp. AF17-16]
MKKQLHKCISELHRILENYPDLPFEQQDGIVELRAWYGYDVFKNVDQDYVEYELCKKIARKMIDEGIVEFKSQTVYEPGAVIQSVSATVKVFKPEK